MAPSVNEILAKHKFGTLDAVVRLGVKGMARVRAITANLDHPDFDAYADRMYDLRKFSYENPSSRDGKIGTPDYDNPTRPEKEELPWTHRDLKHVLDRFKSKKKDKFKLDIQPTIYGTYYKLNTNKLDPREPFLKFYLAVNANIESAAGGFFENFLKWAHRAENKNVAFNAKFSNLHVPGAHNRFVIYTHRKDFGKIQKFITANASYLHPVKFNHPAGFEIIPGASVVISGELGEGSDYDSFDGSLARHITKVYFDSKDKAEFKKKLRESMKTHPALSAHYACFEHN